MSNTKKIIERNMAAFNAQDIETLLGNQCPDVEFVLPGGVTFRGRDQMKRYVQASWSAFPDGKLTRVGQILIESGAATEAVFTGTPIRVCWPRPAARSRPPARKLPFARCFCTGSKTR